jgi:excinuclease ABC subunit A
VTGVSGSGKSTLILDTLYKNLSNHFYRSGWGVAPFKKIEGVEKLDRVVNIDQRPIGRTPRSNPATYVGLFTLIRELYAQLPDARLRGYNGGRFSFNVKGGRCEACQGGGSIRVEMHFMADVFVQCEVCVGKRYNRETLAIKYRDKSIADVLDMSVGEALAFFEHHPVIHRKLQTLSDVGLDYIRVGQSSTTLSGGEAQRIKLSKELSRRLESKSLYILDEPTTGLHFEDIRKLISLLHRLVDNGSSVIVIEHNTDVARSADHIIDLGPEGGAAGGQIIAVGTPDEIKKTKKSLTGQFL